MKQVKSFALVMIAAGLVLVIAAGAYMYYISGAKTNAGSNETKTNDAAKTFTASQVAEHGSKADCWTIIRGEVYDITSYIPRHPGGEEILRACGTDSTTFFENRMSPEGETVGSGQPHSPVASEQLEKMRIGKLTD